MINIHLDVVYRESRHNPLHFMPSRQQD